jgi:hypothetical protein
MLNSRVMGACKDAPIRLLALGARGRFPDTANRLYGDGTVGFPAQLIPTGVTPAWRATGRHEGGWNPQLEPEP